MSEEITAASRRRPAVHRLTYGAFLQGHVWVAPNTLVVPLAPMGFAHAGTYACQYHRELLGVDVQPPAVEAISRSGADALPVLAFIHFTVEQRSPERMEAEALPELGRAEQLIGWISGNYLHDFSFIMAAVDEIYIRLLPPAASRRMLLGPGNVGEALQRNIEKIRDLAAGDERFAYALSLYRDALHETNKLFKIARLFAVLEALAYALKAGGVGSRDAVRRMLGLEAGAFGEVNYDGKTVRYERVALAGQLRDRLFHGARFTRDDLPAPYRDSFDLLTDQPDVLIRDLMTDCELEFARWGNNASVARTAADAA
jgi:hypothetical protein